MTFAMQESPFADLHPVPGRYIPALRELPSDSQGLERLSLGQQEVAEETVTRRSNSGPLSATMLRVLPFYCSPSPFSVWGSRHWSRMPYHNTHTAWGNSVALDSRDFAPNCCPYVQWWFSQAAHS